MFGGSLIANLLRIHRCSLLYNPNFKTDTHYSGFQEKSNQVVKIVTISIIAFILCGYV